MDTRIVDSTRPRSGMGRGTSVDTKVRAPPVVGGEEASRKLKLNSRAFAVVTWSEKDAGVVQDYSGVVLMRKGS